MSGQDTVVGLNSYAKDLVKGCGLPHWESGFDKRKVVAGRDCKTTADLSMPKLVPCVQVVDSENFFYGLGGVIYPLKRYLFRDSTSLEEFLQASPWHSGRKFFLALKNSITGVHIKESLWTQEEVVL